MGHILRPPVMHFLRVLIPDHHQLPLRSVFPEAWRKRELIVETTGERREERDAGNSNRALQKNLRESRRDGRVAKMSSVFEGSRETQTKHFMI